MAKKPVPGVDELKSAIEAKIKALNAPLANGEWKFCIVPPGEDGAGLAAPEYDDSAWPVVQLHHNWSSLDGEAWFRTAAQLPAEIEGIAVTGSQIEMEVFLAIGASIYVDGVERFREPSWTDSRPVPLLLVEDFRPGTPLHLAVRANAGDGFGLFLNGKLRASKIADAIFELDLFNAQMTFTHFLMEHTKGPEARGFARAWEYAVEAVRLDALAANDWAAWHAGVAAARAELAPFAEEAKRYTAFTIAHSHIDMNWLWPMAETVDVCRRDFTTMDRLMTKYPDFHFSQSQAATYAMTEAADPALFERIRARVAEGRWEVTANTWVENDLNMAGSEAMARQMLHARRYNQARFGVDPVICWEPDTFGHPATIPQLLVQAGIKYYYFCRAGRRHPLFWWEGTDGSRVLGVQDPAGYNGEITPSNLADATIAFTQPSGTHVGLFVFGAGDHGGGGTARDIEAALRLDSEPFLPRVSMSSATGFYDAALAELESRHAQDRTARPGYHLGLPVVRGELNTVFEGCYTSHGDIKRLNRAAENNLLTAETAATLAALLTGTPYPARGLAEAWQTACFHQFHDILCGCAIGVTYREANERMGVALDTAEQVTQDAVSALAAATDTGAVAGPADAGLRIAVFNPLAWERTDVVRVPVAAFHGEIPAGLTDDQGRFVPIQLCPLADGGTSTSGTHELLFVATQVPALGMRVYRPAGAQAAEGDGITVDAQANTLDNGVLRLRVHRQSGAIEQLLDHSAQRDVAGPWAGWGPEAKVNAGMLNRLQILWEQPHPMSAWNIGDITRVENLLTGADVRVIESGPVVGVIEVKRKFLSSSMTQRIHLYRGLRRVDFETEVDWHERGSAHADAPMLRTTFAPFLRETNATFEIPFGALTRSADGREVPALRWADVSEPVPAIGRSAKARAAAAVRAASDPPAYGLSLLNDCKYGHQAHGNTLGLTLVRASYEPDGNPDEGLHRFTYALYPHAGDWRAAGTIRRAAELNQPLVATVTAAHGGPLKPGQGWLACDSDQVIVSAVKLAEDQPAEGHAVVVRLYEPYGQAADVMLRPGWAVSGATAADPLERGADALPVSPDGVQVALGEYGIRTVMLS